MMKIVRIQHSSIEVIQLNVPPGKRQEQVSKTQQQFQVVNKQEAQKTVRFRYNNQKGKKDLTKKVEEKRILPLKKQELKPIEPLKHTKYSGQKAQESQKIKTRELQEATENHKVAQVKQRRQDELLHPGWRQFPHTILFGWTENHQLLLDRLEKQVVAGELQSIYYGNELEYHKGPCTLHPPLVRTAQEAFRLIRTGIAPGTLQLKEQYDADDEASPGDDIRTESLWVAEVAVK